MIHVRSVSKIYPPPHESGSALTALQSVTLSIARGESVALMGASGSGKSTLLHLLGGLDAPSSGDIEVDGKVLNQLNDADLSRFRRERLGFVFQFFHLVPTLSVLENILLPARLAGNNDAPHAKRAQDLIERVGLKGREAAPPDTLSGGQQQRVALARALVTQPLVLLADEPTGNLDSANSAAVLDLMTSLVKDSATTLVMATHSPEAAAICKRIVRLKDGSIESDAASR
jgi:putative ABC transport system ATP-binding protein